MPVVRIDCNQCGGDQYRILNTRTGEVMCEYCRNQWIIPALKETPDIVEAQNSKELCLDNADVYEDAETVDYVTKIAIGVVIAVSVIIAVSLFLSMAWKTTATVIENKNSVMVLEYDTKGGVGITRATIEYRGNDLASTYGIVTGKTQDEVTGGNLTGLKAGDKVKIKFDRANTTQIIAIYDPRTNKNINTRYYSNVERK